MAFVNAGEQDLPPDESVLQNVLRQHGVRKHLSKGKWLSRAWNDFDAHAVAAVATRVGEQHELSRADELTVVNSLLRQGRGMGVGPKVARLMMIWDPQTGSMGSAYRRVIPLDRRWINALRQQGEDITCNLGREASYRHVEAQICRAAEHVGMLPFLADGAVFGWAP